MQSRPDLCGLLSSQTVQVAAEDICLGVKIAAHCGHLAKLHLPKFSYLFS